jgi:hypothetical protein
VNGERVHRRHAHGPGEPGHPHRGRRGFMAGVVLMAGSFLVYPAYPVLVLWPVSDPVRVEIAFVAAAVSWGAFSVGLYLGGAPRLGVAAAPLEEPPAARGAPVRDAVIDSAPGGPASCSIS